MSGFQKFVVTQTAPPDPCLTGCLYQVLQATGPPGSNFLQLIPLLKSKDNPSSVAPSRVVPGASSQSLPQSVRVSLPAPVFSPATVPSVTQPVLGNYIIATQRNLANAPKTIRVESRFSTPQDTAIILEKSQPTFQANSPPEKPTFAMMNPNSTSFHVKPTPQLPLGHRLQIPAHAEVKYVPASSLPPSIQQKILSQTGYSDLTKAPSVIFVSPVNAVKTLVNQLTPLGPKPNAAEITLSAKSLPVVSPLGSPPTTSRTDSPKGPMKWIVQETRESAACLVPVSSSNDTASKILQMLSGTKTEEIKLVRSESSKVMQIKDNALVMCNNKIFFLSKRGTELIDTANKNPETPLFTPPTKFPIDSETTKDLSNKVVEVVLSKNKLSPISKQPASISNSPLAHPNMSSSIKPNRTSVTLLPNRNESTLSSSNVGSGGVTGKPQNMKYGLHNTAGATRGYSADKGPPQQDSVKNSDQVIVGTEGTHATKITKAPAETTMADRYWRDMFGLVKKEKVILQRIQFPQPESPVRSKGLLASAKKNTKDYDAQPRKRKFTMTETATASKRTTRENGSQPVAVHAERSGDYILNPSPFSKSSSTAAETAALWSPYGTEESPGSSGSASIYIGQDITGHFSEVTLPRQRFRCGTLLSSHVDETTKDEKIQRLKEVLKEREQALEALRGQKKH